ncbi:MAG: hypothetical protein Q9163_001786 [Psora crenata]
MSSSGTDMPTPPADEPLKSLSPNFDIVTHYTNILQTDREINKPIAAIESLIALLSASPSSTVSETLALIESSTATLKASVPNSIALSAGTDLFQRYIISTLQTGALSNTGRKGGDKARDARDGDDFAPIRAHLLANSKTFVQRAKEARWKIAGVAKRFVRDGTTVLTCGGSRVVTAVLRAAADEGVDFRVIYVMSRQAESESSWSAQNLVGDLRRRHISVAIIPFAALATAVSKASFAIVGAESVVENGGVISTMGTNQLGLLAKSVGRPFYVVAESHKFARLYPLSAEDLGMEKDVLDFRTDVDEDGNRAANNEYQKGRRRNDEISVDFTPPELITALVTEAGVHTTSAVSEELFKIWY